MDFEASIIADVPTIGDIREKKAKKPKSWTYEHSGSKFAPTLHLLSETQETFPIFFVEEIYGFVFRLRGTVLAHEI